MHIQSMLPAPSIERQSRSVELAAQYFALLNRPELIMQGDLAWRSSGCDS